MYTITRRNPNGVPVAEPATLRRRTGIGAGILAIRWATRGYAVDVEKDATSLAAIIRRRPAARLAGG